MIEHYYLATSSPEANALLNWILSALLLGGLYFMIKKLQSKPSNKGEPSTPVHVKMEDHFVTRREFDELRAMQVRDLTKLEEMQLRTFDKMDERDQQLKEIIESVAKSAVAGRLRIHEDIKTMRDRVVRCETKLEHPNQSKS